MRIVPSHAHPSTTTPQLGAPSAPGVHDTLRSNLSLAESKGSTTSTQQPQLESAHPLEARLTQWRSSQDSLKMEMLRRQFGIAEPVKRGMEAQIVAAGEWRPACLGGDAGFGAVGGSVHGDILAGRDCEIGWEDVFTGREMRDEVSFHAEMERGWGMGW